MPSIQVCIVSDTIPTEGSSLYNGATPVRKKASLVTPSHGASLNSTPARLPSLQGYNNPSHRRYGTPTGSVSSQLSNSVSMQRNSLICPLCSEYFSNPLMLPCLHSFCKKCLLHLVSNDSSKCPTCRASRGLINEGSVRQLPKNLWLAHQVEIATYEEKLSNEQSNVPCDRCVKQANGFAVVFCSECCMFLCRSCRDDHKWCRDTVKHELIDVGRALKRNSNPAATVQSISNPPLQHKPVMCFKHSGENYKFYCQSCEELICQECMVHEHKDHEHVYLEQIASHCRHELQEWLDKCNYAMSDLEVAICNVDQMYQLVQERKKGTEDEIDMNCEMLHKAIEERRRILRDKCKDVATGKRDVLQSQLDDFQNIKELTDHTIQESSNAIMNQSSAEIVCTQRVIMEQMKQAYSQFKQICLNLSADDVILTTFNVAWVTEHIAQFGSFTDLCIPEKSGIQNGLAIPYAIVGKERRLKVVLRDDYGLPMKTTVPFQASIKGIGEHESEMLKVEVTQLQDGSTDLSFKPETAGCFELSVKVRSESICGGPFRLYFREERNYRNIDSPQVFTVGQYTYGVAVHSCGDVFASNNVNGCIQVFHKDGTEKMKFGQPGSGNGQMNKPWGLAIHGDILYAVDRGNRRVLAFSTAGDSLGQFGAADLVDPMGISIDNRGHVFVTDGPKHRVQVFSTEGVHKHTISCHTYPYDVAIDNTGHIHVTYYNNRSIQLFPGGAGSRSPPQAANSPVASLLSLTPPHFRLPGSLSDMFTGPANRQSRSTQSTLKPQKHSNTSATDEPVTYYNNSCIQVFSPDGKRGLYSYSTDGSVVYPTGLAMDDEGYRFVADSNHHYLRILDPSGKEIHRCEGLNFPYGVAIDTSGHIYIADSSNYRIVKY